LGNTTCSLVTSSTDITLTDCPPIINVGSILIGTQTGAMGVVTAMQRNGVNKFFDTFIQMHKYDATVLSGTFLNNELVSQGNNYGYVHHTEGTTNISIFITGMNQVFQANSTTIRGNTSGAQATITHAYKQEIEFGSGGIEYLENINPVTRQNTQSETFQILLNF
jgi:hypothetical protein